MTHSKEFLEDPVYFSRRHVLLPGLGGEDPSGLKSKPVREGFTLYQVHGQRRIVFGNVVRKPTEVNRYDVEIDAAQLTDAWFPFYWLPWQANQTYRIKLKRSEKRLVWTRNERLADPQVFFTAALSGCTVLVDGDPREPTVYHSNAQSHEPVGVQTQMEKFQGKVAWMEERLDASEELYPIGERHYAPRSANLFRYMGEGLSPKYVDELREDKARQLKLPRGQVSPNMGATVFGIRSRTHGMWTFYVQSWTTFIYFKNDTPHKEWIVNRCERFWPGEDIQKPIPIVFVD